MRWMPFALLLVLLTGCEMPVDRDTDWSGAHTSKFGEGSITWGVPANGRSFAEPRYLPDWAPMYPGAEVMGKLVQRDAKGIIGRGTDLRATGPIGKVADFYAAAIARAGRAVVSQSRAETVATFILAPVNGYNNSIVIHALTGGEPPRVTIAIAVSTDR